MLKISWEAGHAGFGVTPGKRALDGSMYEWDFNNGCGLYFAEELAKYDGIELLRVDDPTGKVDISLKDRAKKSNEWGAHLHISYHGNAADPTAHGIETFVHPSASKLNRDVALHIHNYIINATKRRNRGLKEADFQILRDTKADSLLIEGGFMTNSEELALMKTNDYRALVGKAVASAIVTKFNLKQKPKPVNSYSLIPFKVIIPNTAFWQTRSLTVEFMARGYKAYGKINTLGEPKRNENNDPMPFVIETNYEQAVLLVKELQGKGYKQAYGEKI
jgi:N-acetylmuramoyl-L-alanine amidase